ncbi:hypothetical protein EAF00_011026 [Botryotinia globosa]|nr:hypothetical protein EAF00_011026 [Botryotinia globosa]
MGYLSDFGGVLLGILLVCYLLDAARLRARHKQFMKRNYCEEPPERSSKYPFDTSRIYHESSQGSRKHVHREVYRYNNHLYHRSSQSSNILHLRKKAFCPLLGDGVFSTDGPFWEHSRALIRPTFTRFNVANFPAFEIHLQKFLKLIPKDRRIVNLSSLLDDLFLDTSTEFIFGESVNALDESSDEASESHKFLNAFHHAQRGISIRSQLRTLSFLYQGQRRAVHKFVDAHIDKALELRREYLASKKSFTNPDPSGSSDEKEEEEEEENHR